MSTRAEMILIVAALFVAFGGGTVAGLLIAHVPPRVCVAEAVQ
jgi:uncharacterized membrane protein YeiH